MPNIDKTALFKLSYGLFVLTAREGDKDNGCIINTAMQIANPQTVMISVNKQNYTHDMIMRTGVFNISVLDTTVPFKVFEKFGFSSGKSADKFASCTRNERSENGLRYIPHHTNAFLSCKVISATDCQSHTVFIAEVTEAKILSDKPSVTYEYYFQNIKPKPQQAESKGKRWECQICGFVYDEAEEGVAFEDLPEDWTCPLCKHPKSEFVLAE